MKYKLKLEKLKQKGGMMDLFFYGNDVVENPFGKIIKEDRQKKFDKAAAKAAEEAARAKAAADRLIQEKKYLERLKELQIEYRNKHEKTLTLNYNEREKIFNLLPDSPMKDIYNQIIKYPMLYLNNLEDTLHFSKYINMEYDWILFDIINIPYNILEDTNELLFPNINNNNNNLTKRIDNFRKYV